jgi:predicted nicotinamide N-methyase
MMFGAASTLTVYSSTKTKPLAGSMDPPVIVKQPQQHDTMQAPPEEPKEEPFLTIHGIPIYFQEDWTTGIGGGLWSTGLALARYFKTDHAAQNLCRLECRSILELGSGNGLLSVCLAALLVAPHKQQHFVGTTRTRLVATDLDEDHLAMMRRTWKANTHLHGDSIDFQVQTHVWGEFDEPQHATKFDLIVASDVAYREELYDPLIASLLHFSHAQTVILLGVTMSDTKPAFFELLERAGFVYEKFSDHLLEVEFRGTTFGIFVLRKKNKA